MMRRVLIASDKFKGSLSAQAVGQAIARGLMQSAEPLEITLHPMADGGDGSLAILSNHLDFKTVSVNTQDPLGRAIQATYFTTEEAAFIELASASGHVLLQAAERNPLLTSTYGTGQMIRDAIAHGYTKIYLFLGGSATNDAGIGIAQALGLQFLDAQQKPLPPTGESLAKIASIHDQQWIDFSQIQLTLFYDVANPLYGPTGAAQVYAPQKGANPAQVEYLDGGLVHFRQIVLQERGIDIQTIVGGGSAGGIGAGLVGLCGAEMRKGFEVMAQLTQLEEKIKASDWVISGEGKLDEQSLQGKVIDGIADLCKKHQKSFALFVGKNDLSEKALAALHCSGLYSISTMAKNQQDAIQNGAFYLEALAREITFSNRGFL